MHHRNVQELEETALENKENRDRLWQLESGQMRQRNPPNVEGPGCLHLCWSWAAGAILGVTVTGLEVEVATPPAGLDSPHFSFFGCQNQVVSLAGQTRVCLCFCCQGCWETTPGLASVMGRCSASCRDAQSGKFPRGAG